MRTFGTFLVAVIFAGAAGCGDSSGTSGTGTDGGPSASIDANTSGGGGYTSPTGRSPATGGMCPSSSTGQTCTGEQAYMDCLITACGTQAQICFGNNYMKGDYTGGVCAQFLTCEMACPCDDTGTLCMANCAAQYVYSSPDCTTCVTSLSACTQAAACQQPVCTTTGTPTSTATSTSTITATGASCTAAQACCASLPATLASECQTNLASAGGLEVACTAVLSGYQMAGYCTSTTSTTTATTTMTTTTTPTATATTTATGANCSALQACCVSIPAAVAPSCQSSLSAAAGVEATCATVLQAFQTAGYCAAATSTTTATATSTSTATTTATGTGCASLQKCCASMSSTTATACQSAYTSAAGVDSSCTLVLQQFQAAGLCK